jgi:5-formyltetrahydrofolate cyclo-ligase
MTFRVVDDVAQMAELGFGFREPPLAAPTVVSGELDVIVVPALAIDPTGHRIGYGAGFYDRTLARFPNAIPIGVAYDFQLIAEVPVTEGDIATRWIVTDTRVLPAVSASPAAPPF